MALIVETSCGKLGGIEQDGVIRFLGVPYGAHTGGEGRFLPAKPAQWSGVRDATDCGPPSPQNAYGGNDVPHLAWLRDNRPMDENCLTLNVFTSSLDPSLRKPVMLYLHGGGFTVGSAGPVGLDGSNLARRGIVLVSLNHRLNLFGHLYLGDADGGRYADSGNVGMLDCVAALNWVQKNIALFGGDAGNVTVFGQSGGGSKVAMLMAMPDAKGLFHKAIIQSASSLLAPATLEESERNTDFFLAQIGVDRSNLRRLHEIPAADLLKAMGAAVCAAGQVDNYRPVIDTRSLPARPFDSASVSRSATVPLMVGWCENEQRLAFAGTLSVYDLNWREAQEQVARMLTITSDQAEDLMQAYRRARPEDRPGDIYAQILGDHRYRRSVTSAAELQIEHGGAPVYMYLLRWKTPVKQGLLRTPHTLCIPFVFGNVDLATGITGNGDDRYVLQEQMLGAWVAFASTGRPGHAGLPEWRPYTPVERQTMVFAERSQLVSDPMREERIVMSACPPYVPARWEGRRIL